MIKFCTIEITIGKGALNKSYPNKITSGKITIHKLTRFKFFEMHFFLTISGVLIDGVKEIGCHTVKGLYFDWIIDPAKLRFENTIKTKKRSSELGVFSFNCIYS
jgi:hypothetical protein